MRTPAILAFFVFLSAPVSSQSTWYVPDHWPTIQVAINSVANGDTVIVRPGTYEENLDFVGKVITLRSELGPEVTVIDGNQLDRVVQFQSGETRDCVLEGFTITNGNASSGNGGGIDCTLISSPTIRNCILSFNRAFGLGGGIACRGFSNAVIIGCTFIGNDCHGAVEGSQGGGLSCFFSDVTVTGCTFIDNASQWGGAIDFSGSRSIVTNCAFVGNYADLGGGALFCSVGYPTVTNCTFNRNSAAFGGALVTAGAVLSSHPVLTNCILWDNQPEEILIGIGKVTVTYCDVMGGWIGSGNIDVFPGFFDLDSRDFHLTWDSPCVDAGDNLAPSLPLFDYEGDGRVVGGTADMGADELEHHLYHTGSVVPGGTINIRTVGTPGSPVTLALGSGIQDPPQPSQYGNFYLMRPLIWSGSIGVIPAQGILTYPVIVPSMWLPGSKHPLQALVGPFGSAGSRLTNLLELTAQ